MQWCWILVLSRATLGRVNRHGDVHEEFSERLPLVSIISASFGQFWCNRNVLLNACYSNWPRHRLELLLAETGLVPSPLFLKYATNELNNAEGLGSRASGNRKLPIKVDPALAYEGSFCGGIRFRYFFFDGRNFENRLHKTSQRETAELDARRPMIGKLRNFLISKATGEIAINMDNDDFYSPNYVRRIVLIGVQGRLPGGGAVFGVNHSRAVAAVSAQETALATVLSNGTVSIAVKRDARKRAAEIWRKLKRGMSCHQGTRCTDNTEYHLTTTRIATDVCEYATNGMSEGRRLILCIDKLGLLWRDVTMMPDDLRVAYPNSISVFALETVPPDVRAALSQREGPFALMKIVSGLSITAQTFSFRDNPNDHFSQLEALSLAGWRHHLDGQRAFYEMMHHITRPRHIPALDDDPDFLARVHSPRHNDVEPTGRFDSFRRRPGKIILSDTKLSVPHAMTTMTCLAACKTTEQCTGAEFENGAGSECRLLLGESRSCQSSLSLQSD